MLMIYNFLSSFFNLDTFAIIMIALVSYIGCCVISFASRFMKGDAQYHYFFIKLIMLIMSVIIMVSADHLALLLIASYASNILLVRLMIHKASWRAAKASGLLAAKNYFASSSLIAAAFILFYLSTGKTSIDTIVHQNTQSFSMLCALVLILIAATIQSAIWPFHKWLVSSLNSPTPVSAIMHAGLINSGGFLLVRFSPLYLECPNILLIIFCIGLITALTGTIWKLIQPDIKRMLACSTMSQMGFMLVQCGLGLFPSAVAHLVWHSSFKAYLFLSSGGSTQEKKQPVVNQPKAMIFIYALICGIGGSLSFGYASNKWWTLRDTTFVLMIIALIAATQLALTILHANIKNKYLIAMTASMTASFFYGNSVYVVTYLMKDMQIMQPQVLNGIHILGTIALALGWLLMLVKGTKPLTSSIALKCYVKALNASQANPATVTPLRNDYQY